MEQQNVRILIKPANIYWPRFSYCPKFFTVKENEPTGSLFIYPQSILPSQHLIFYDRKQVVDFNFGISVLFFFCSLRWKFWFQCKWNEIKWNFNEMLEENLGSIIGKISAEDMDEGTNDELLKYSIVHSSSLGLFAIDPDSAELFLTRSLHWEKVRE